MAVGGIFVTLRAVTSKFQSDMSKAQSSVGRFRKSIVNINRQLKKVGKTMSKVGKQMSTNFSLPIVAAGGLAIKTFADFEQEMAKVKAVSGATGDEFKKLESLAKSLGESTRFTASEVATLQLNYSKLGFVPEEIQKITKSTLDLALATGEDLAQSAEVAGGILRAFGKTAEEMPMVVDIMAKSFSSSALNLDKFRDAMKSAAPVANAVGASLADTTAIISTMVDANIDASTAGTTLRNMFLELSSKGLTWDQAITKIKTSTNKARTANELFGKRGVAGALVIADNTEKLERLSKEYNNAGGSAKKMATIMDDTLQGSLLKVQSALEGAAIELGETLAPVIKKVGAFIADLAQKFSALAPKSKKMIAIVAGITAAVGPLLVVFGFLVSTVLPGLIAGFALLLSPISLIIGALAGIAAVAVGVFNHFTRIKTAQEGLTEVMLDARQSIAGEVSEIDKLITIAKSELLSREKRQEAVDELNSKYPELNKNITLEGINSEETAKQILKLKDSILKMAQARAIENRIEKIAAERLELITSKGESALTSVDEFAISILNAVAPVGKFGDALVKTGLQESRLEEQTRALKEEEDLLLFSLQALEKQGTSTTQSIVKQTAAEKALAEAEKARAKAAKEFAGPTGIKGGVSQESTAPKRAKAVSGEDVIPLIIQLRRAREEAALLSKAFSEEPKEALQRQADAVKSFVEESVKANGTITPEIQEQISIYDALQVKIKETTDSIKANAERTADFIKGVTSQIATSLGEALGEALVSGDPLEAFKGFIKSLLGIIKAFGSLLIAIGTGLVASVFTIPIGTGTIAAGIALIAASSAGAALLAEGGLIFGETLAVVGEGRGTNRANPEVVAPLDKLQSMLTPQQMGGGESRVIIRGEELIIVQNKTMENRSFTIRE